jgi:glycosyltransferase involved in cell wall biosynthesis
MNTTTVRASATRSHHPNTRELPSLRRPRVSIIVLCYNYAHWLTDCITSILTQEGVDVDVLIVNDASSDNSADVAHRLEAEDSRVRLIDHKQNCGQIPCLNQALHHVSGDYIVKMDADDMLAKGSLARSTALLETHPNVGFVYGRALYFGKDLATLPVLDKFFRRNTFLITDNPPTNQIDTQVRGWTIWPSQTWISLLYQRGANCISQPEVVMRASALRAAGSYDVDLPHTFDLAMWLRLASISDVGHIDGAIQGLYRFHLTSMQRTVNSGKLKDLRGRLAAFDSVLIGQSEDISNIDDLLTMVHIRLATEALDEACRAFDRGRAHTEPVDEYMAFALEAYPEAESLPQWRSLQRRQRVGPRWSPYWPPFMIRTVIRRASEEIARAHWWRNGV